MPKHIQFIHRRTHVAVGITTDSITIPAALAVTIPADEANINVLVSQGYVLHTAAGGDADLSFTMGALLGDNTRVLSFSRNLDNEWVKVQWFGAE